MAVMSPERIFRRHAALEPEFLMALGYVTTAELLGALSEAAQVMADARKLNVTLVRELLLEWEVHRPPHP